MKKFFYQADNRFFVLNEDIVGWYLIIYKDNSMRSSLEDHLFGSYAGAIKIAKED